VLCRGFVFDAFALHMAAELVQSHWTTGIINDSSKKV
jgi:hypothetical protein